MEIKVGDTPVKMVRMESKDKRCASCGARCIEEIAAPGRGQLKYEMAQGRFHSGRVFCPRGCKAGWKQDR